MEQDLKAKLKYTETKRGHNHKVVITELDKIPAEEPKDVTAEVTVGFKEPPNSSLWEKAISEAKKLNDKHKAFFLYNGLAITPSTTTTTSVVLSKIYPDTLKWPTNTSGCTYYRKILIDRAKAKSIHPVLFTISVFTRGDAKSKWVNTGFWAKILANPTEYSSCHPTAHPLYDLFRDSSKGESKIGKAGGNGAGGSVKNNKGAVDAVIAKIDKPDDPGNVVWLTYGDHSILILIYKDNSDNVKMESIETWASGMRYGMQTLHQSMLKAKEINPDDAKSNLPHIYNAQKSQSQRQTAFQKVSVSGWVDIDVAVTIGTLKSKNALETAIDQCLDGTKNNVSTWDGYLG